MIRVWGGKVGDTHTHKGRRGQRVPRLEKDP